jgi:hypothetical protein
MGLFSKIKKLFLFNDTGTSKDLIDIHVRCNKCGEQIDSYFRKNYDLQSNYGAGDWAYLIDKNLVCPGCYQSIAMRVEFDKRLNSINSELAGGEFIIDEDSSQN